MDIINARSEKTKQIYDLIKKGYTASEIASKTNSGINNVYRIAYTYDVCIARRWRKKITDEEKLNIRNYVSQGHSRKEAAKHFDIGYEKVKAICKGIPQQYINQYGKKFQDEALTDIQSHTNNFVVVGEYKGHTKPIELQCKVCGHIIKRNVHQIKYSNDIECPMCKEKAKAIAEQEKEKAKAEAKAKAQAKAQAKKLAREKLKQEQRKKKEHPCAVCGCMTIRPKYCSDKCAKKVINKNKEIKRRNAIKAVMIDKDITLEALYKRDKGRCHICGMQCNYDDYVMKGNTFIAGNYYPSIDHVKPLAKGGKHSWINVRLAHRGCNSYKSDKMA